VPESDLKAHPEDDDDEDPEEDPVDYPADGGDDGDDEEGSSEDDDMDIEADEEEEKEHPAPADSVVVALTAADQAPSTEETEPFETDELGIALGPGYEVGESSSAAAARPAGGLKADSGDLTGSTKTEARLSREAWVRSTDTSDLVRAEVMSLRTTVLGQMTEIRELHAADRRRQIMISEMLRADHRRSTEIIELRTALQG
nr:hypothetical protein [Tanacetum cinerariifolium]